MSTFEFLKNYDGIVKVNNKKATAEDIDKIDLDEDVDIELIPRSLCEEVKHRIYVKQWMTNSSANLDFHQRWNNNNPMSTREIVCKIVGETPGMLVVDGVCSDGKHWKGYISKTAIIEDEEV